MIDIENGDLSRNRGAAYEQVGDKGRAMLHYLRALRLRPDDADAKAGVARIESQREDRLVLPLPSSIEMAWERFANSLGLATWSYLWLVAALFTGIVGAWYLAEPKRVMKPLARRSIVAGLVVTVIVTLPFCWRVWRFENDLTAVIIASESRATEDPKGGAKRFTLHAGMVGVMGEREGDKRRFTLPNGVTGWVKESTVAPVAPTS